ncbi:hypothetical protein R69658_04318 [Paraburkholderia aspalathi]|uniref:Uncharacterized protein n=1 Tax=Paraburkholderia aspalathi TaxID=1324617 RepID=A0ABM8S388_9BURK|nr:hypothetical protein R69658_04318 [Paraburkholderia aspalathi]
MSTFRGPTRIMSVLRFDSAKALDEESPVDEDCCRHTPPIFLTSKRKKAQGFGAALDDLRRRTAKGWMQ